MIPNQWYAVLDSREVKPGRPVGVTRLGEKMVFWRDAQGRIACALDRCPHRGTKLSTGKIIDGNVECPFHGFQYEPSGRCTYIPANGRSMPVPKIFLVKTYPVQDAHGFIWVWYGEKLADDDAYPPLRYIPDIDASFNYGTYPVHWKTHYSRAIENQLDVLHLPFVHKSTIGRSDKRLVNGPPSFLSEQEELRVWVDNAIDTGQTARKPSQYTEPPDRPHQLCFVFPNIWENRVSDDVRVVIAFAPIDDANTMMYLRFYHRFVQIPVVTQVVSWLGARMNNVIARQDQPVVEDQRPFRTDLLMDEKMVPGDAPIIMYRRRRRELIDAQPHDYPPLAELPDGTRLTL
jgi:phenylpropionate dioxygenase-like ring-hydroxylating dioxygenase large terminal subunit